VVVFVVAAATSLASSSNIVRYSLSMKSLRLRDLTRSRASLFGKKAEIGGGGFMCVYVTSRFLQVLYYYFSTEFDDAPPQSYGHGDLSREHRFNSRGIFLSLSPLLYILPYPIHPSRVILD